MKVQSPAILALLVVFAGGLIAQPQVPNGSSSSPASAGEKVIKGTPFSADTIDVTDMVMPNGQRERHELHGRYCRDSQGRTYGDLGFRSSGEVGMPPILINDPVAHTLITLDPVRKEAVISDSQPRPLKVKSTGIPPPPEPRQPRTVKVEDLGTQVMEGLTVKGTRTTKTYSLESEAVDPDNSFVMTTWYSDDLQIGISSEVDNGKRGSSQHKTVDIVRTEPDVSLFQIPPGYKVFDQREKLGANEEQQEKAPEINLQDLAWTDPSTGLMWTRMDNGINVNWKQADQYCGKMSVGGYSNWRLPTIDELNGIYDQKQNVGGYHIKGGIRLSNCCPWSSTLHDPEEAWLLHFMGGGRIYGRLDFTFRVLCVRSPGK